MFTVRLHPAGGDPRRSFSRDHKFATKREALKFIQGLGDLAYIKRTTKMWIVRPKPKRMSAV